MQGDEYLCKTATSAIRLLRFPVLVNGGPDPMCVASMALMAFSPAQQTGLRSAPVNRSAGRPPEQLLDTAALTLSRTARAAVAGSHHDGLLARRRGRAVVDIALGGNRCAGTLGDHPLDDHDVFAPFVMQPHLITGPYGMRGLDPYPVDPDVPGPAGTGRGRAGPGQPHRPDPAVHPPSLITCHPANCNAVRARWLPPARCPPRRPRRSAACAEVDPAWPP